MAIIIIKMPLKFFMFQLPLQQVTMVKTQMPLNSSKLVKPKMNQKVMPPQLYKIKIRMLV
jgi:hypothetical protein